MSQGEEAPDTVEPGVEKKTAPEPLDGTPVQALCRRGSRHPRYFREEGGGRRKDVSKSVSINTR